MAEHIKRVALYLRISLDKREGAGVERQEQACRKLVASNPGWEVAGVYVDNSISAYSRRPRPQYERLLADIKADRLDVVVAWDPDRLHRRPIELNEYIELTESHNVTTRTVNAGYWDLSTPAGRVQARIMGDLASYESEHKAERVRAALEQAAFKGQPRHGGVRALGYRDDDRSKAEPFEAECLRWATEQLLAGVSLRSVARELNERGLTGVRGGQLTTGSLKNALINPRLAGLSTWNPSDSQGRRLIRNRQTLDVKGQWEAIISEEQHHALVALFANPARQMNKVGSAPRHLLSGIAVCGKCGAPMYARKKYYKRKAEEEPKRVYYCKGTGGGHPTRIADPLDRYITALVLERLERGDLMDSLARSSGEPDRLAGLATQRDTLRQRLSDLETQATAGTITMEQFGRMNVAIGEQLAAVEGELVDLSGAGDALTEAAKSEDVNAWWTTAPLDLRREVIRSLMAITVLHTPGPQARFNPEYIDVQWLV